MVDAPKKPGFDPTTWKPVDPEIKGKFDPKTKPKTASVPVALDSGPEKAAAAKSEKVSVQKAEPKSEPKTSYAVGKGKHQVHKDIGQHGGKHIKAAAMKFALTLPAPETPKPRVATGERAVSQAHSPHSLQDVENNKLVGYADKVSIEGHKGYRVSNFATSDDIRQELRGKGYVEIEITVGGRKERFFVKPEASRSLQEAHPGNARELQ